jgi:hypothetical protein
MGTGLLSLSGRAQTAALSVYEVGLPWLLGYLQFRSDQWSVLALILGGALLLLHAALLQAESSRIARWIVRLAAAVMLLLPIVARQPVATAIVAVALLGPVGQQIHAKWREADRPWSGYRRSTQAWWWLAMAGAAWAVGTMSGIAVWA